MSEDRSDQEVIVSLHGEALRVSRRAVEGATVRVSTVVHTRDALVDELLSREDVVIERVEIRLIVDQAPAVREEGDTVIVPVVEEVLVTERRLFLKEEVRIRRVRTTERFQQVVALREEAAVVTRVLPALAEYSNPNHGADIMVSETIVAVFDTPALAPVATMESAPMEPRSMEPRSMEPGMTKPGMAGTGLTETGSPATGAMDATTSAAAMGTTAVPTGVAVGAGEEVISLSEETLQVGKRAVERGTTRVRRFVVERPVEEQIRLRDEHVSVFRRPVTGAAETRAGADAFSEKIVEMTETGEEAVVGKSSHVVEEVVVRKEAGERVETIHDTLRREDVSIEGGQTDHGAAAAVPSDGLKPV